MKPVAALLLLGLASCAAVPPQASLSPAADQPTPSDPAVQAEERQEKQLNYDAYLADLDVVWRVGDKLSVANAALCRNRVAYQSGIHSETLAATPVRYRSAAVAEFPQIAKAATIVYVAPDSPAAHAELQPGDIVEAVNTIAIPADQSAASVIATAFAQAGAAPSSVRVRRGSALMTVAVHGVLACDYPLTVVDDDTINSYTNRDGIFIDRGMLAQLHSDDELAVVLGHEFGHNISGQVEGGLGLTAELAFRGDEARIPLEEEADYIGLYAMARAGYDVAAAPKMWRRLAVSCMPEAIDAASDHPSFPTRIVMLRREVAEVEGKMARRAPLIPDDPAVKVATIPVAAALPGSVR